MRVTLKAIKYPDGRIEAGTPCSNASNCSSERCYGEAKSGSWCIYRVDITHAKGMEVVNSKSELLMEKLCSQRTI